MSHRAWPTGLLATLLLAACAVSFAQSKPAIPPLTGHVTDVTGTLTAQQHASLEQKLVAYEARKGSQVAVLIVPTTQPEEIEPYAVRVFEQAKIGRGVVNGKRVDDGALLVVSKNDRRMRIETGYGLEGVLPDITANRIIQESIGPLFRQGDYYGGINAGLDQLLRVIDGEPLPEPDHRWQGGRQPISNSLPVLIFIVFAASAFLRQFLGRGGGAVATGAVAGVLAWLFSRVVPIALFAGGISFLFALLAGGVGSGWSNRGPRGGWGGGLGGGGFGGGGFGGGGSWGGGGGFSGGGGRSGGGGASGSW